MARTLVLQSHTDPLPFAWLADCMRSVRRWSELYDFDYEFIRDELFDRVPPALLEKTRSQPVVATDLARLKALQAYLAGGYETVIWLDSDVLIFDPEHFDLPPDDYALGREVWVQRHRANPEKLIAHVKVHNAFLMFRRGNTFLDFYADTAERLLRENTGSMPPQFIGPKLLTAIHNVVQCPVAERAGMLSPLVIADIAAGYGPALDLFKQRSPSAVAAVNLCGSSYQRGEVSDDILAACVARLVEQKERIFT